MDPRNTQLNLAHVLWETGAFKDKSKSPGGQGFRLALHKKNPDAPLSPVYIDMRVLRSFPQQKRVAAQCFVELMRRGSLRYHRLVDLPISVTPIVSTLSDITNIGMITPREPKDHGTQATIEGAYEPGMNVAVFDDLITKGDTKFAALDVLRNAGLQVCDVFVLLDREQGGSQMLREQGHNVHAVLTLRGLISIYARADKITAEQHDEIAEYLNNQ